MPIILRYSNDDLRKFTRDVSAISISTDEPLTRSKIWICNHCRINKTCRRNSFSELWNISSCKTTCTLQKFYSLRKCSFSNCGFNSAVLCNNIKKKSFFTQITSLIFRSFYSCLRDIIYKICFIVFLYHVFVFGIFSYLIYSIVNFCIMYLCILIQYHIYILNLYIYIYIYSLINKIWIYNLIDFSPFF